MEAAQLEIWYNCLKLKNNKGQYGWNLENNDLLAKEQKEKKKVEKVNNFKECNKNELSLK